MPWRRERLPTTVFWPREVYGPYSPWGHKESETTERLLLSLGMQKTVSLDRYIFAFVAFALGVKSKKNKKNHHPELCQGAPSFLLGVLWFRPYMEVFSVCFRVALKTSIEASLVLKVENAKISSGVFRPCPSQG